MYEVNKEIAKEIIKKVIEDNKRKTTLKNALDRNFILTSTYNLEDLTLEIYKQGFYLILKGTRCYYKVFAKDNDGELELVRKPKKLDFIYSENDKTEKIYHF